MRIGISEKYVGARARVYAREHVSENGVYEHGVWMQEEERAYECKRKEQGRGAEP